MRLQTTVATLFVCSFTAIAFSADKGAPNPKVVDSGSFGVFVEGKRVATETFKIEQRTDASFTHAEIRIEKEDRAAQSSDMQLAANGDLIRYHWQQSGTKNQVTVEPNNEFLVEHLDVEVKGEVKSQAVPHVLATSTVILDDNFFSQREVLVWKYLATVCNQGGDGLNCKSDRTTFSTLDPNQHTAATVYMEYGGTQKTQYKGGERELASFKLETESEGEWLLWLDDQHKLLKITIPGTKTEVVRD